MLIVIIRISIICPNSAVTYSNAGGDPFIEIMSVENASCWVCKAKTCLRIQIAEIICPTDPQTKIVLLRKSIISQQGYGYTNNKN